MASKKQQQSRLDAMKPRVKPVDLFSSLKLELSALIVIATAIAFAMCWFLLKFGWSGWIAMPLTLVVALGITYFFSRGITAPLRQMRDVAEAMADGDYTVRVDIDAVIHPANHIVIAEIFINGKPFKCGHRMIIYYESNFV